MSSLCFVNILRTKQKSKRQSNRSISSQGAEFQRFNALFILKKERMFQKKPQSLKSWLQRLKKQSRAALQMFISNHNARVSAFDSVSTEIFMKSPHFQLSFTSRLCLVLKFSRI